MRTDNSIILTLFNIAHVEINAICATYNIVLNCNSVAVIKDRIWRSFVDNDSRWCFLSLGLVHFVVYFICVFLYFLPFDVIKIDW